MIIYRITNKISGMVYIGQTKQSFIDRIHQHIQRKSRVGKDISSLGKDNFIFDIVDIAETQDEADRLERKWISFYAGKTYNILSGGKPTKNEMEILQKIKRCGKRRKKVKRPPPLPPVVWSESVQEMMARRRRNG